MNPEEQFCRTLEDLAECAESTDRYHVVRSAGLMRKLILDGQMSLLHQVNRQYRLAIRFDVLGGAGEWPDGVPQPIFHSAFTFGKDWPHGPREFRKLDAFLALKACAINGTRVSVKDLILFAAHVLGGVHSGAPKDSLEKTLHSLNRSLTVDELPAVCDYVRTAARITHDALQPLYHSVRRANSPCPCESGRQFRSCHGAP